MHPMLNIAIQAARNAGKIIVRFLDQLDVSDISEKSRNDFVTKVDKLAEQEIIQTIRRSYPKHSFLGEESGLHFEDEKFCWIIDPLDGTKNYIHGLPHFAVSIALTIHQVLEVGVVYDPIRQELFTAAKGKGAHLNNRRIRVANCTKLEKALLLSTDLPFRAAEHEKTYLETFEHLFHHASGIRFNGSAALDLAYIAAGRGDASLGLNLKSWDLAAGVLLIQEAGGIVSDFEGKNNYLESGNIFTANSKLHQTLLKLIQEPQ